MGTNLQDLLSVFEVQLIVLHVQKAIYQKKTQCTSESK